MIDTSKLEKKIYSYAYCDDNHERCYRDMSKSIAKLMKKGYRILQIIKRHTPYDKHPISAWQGPSEFYISVYVDKGAYYYPAGQKVSILTAEQIAKENNIRDNMCSFGKKNNIVCQDCLYFDKSNCKDCEYVYSKHLFRPDLDFNKQELEGLKMHLIHSVTGWDEDGNPDDNTALLLKKIDFALGEPDVFDEDYGYNRSKVPA